MLFVPLMSVSAFWKKKRQMLLKYANTFALYLGHFSPRKMENANLRNIGRAAHKRSKKKVFALIIMLCVRYTA